VRIPFPISAGMPAFTPTTYGTDLFHSDYTFSGTAVLMAMPDRVV